MSSPHVLSELEASPFRRTHRFILIVISAIFFFDLADLNTFAYAAPVLKVGYHYTIGDIAGVTSASFLAMAIGSIAAGWFANLVGRRKGLIVSVALFSVGSLANATVTQVWEMGLTRFLTGLGLGAMTAIALTYVAEVAPAASRGRMQSISFATGMVGIPVAAFVARFLVGLPGESWRGIFVFGALGILLIPFLMRLPESPRWLLLRGQTERALESTSSIIGRELSAGHVSLEPFHASSVGNGSLATYVSLFRNGLARRTIGLLLAWVLLFAGFYGFSSWVPTLLSSNGHSVTKSLLFTSIMSIGSFPGALFSAVLIDRFSRRKLLGIFCLLVACCGVFYGLARNDVSIMLLGLAVTFFSQTTMAILFAYTPEQFPTRQRMAGTALSNAFGRLSNVAFPLIVAMVFGAAGYVPVFFMVSAAWVAGAIAVFAFGASRTGKSIDAEQAAPTVSSASPSHS
ncbi:MFS transporter [Arthrobacter sp. SDTb3-6]|uniref:MFS transporter n=1 Tax=Arthrobacter sp. SDTb3-6 TaxID=2713571 RepID=UPI00159D89D2|nr:MFS transporter [Arthrobacter sp. SDTb3-6]NVM98490.1 MFS transporter [Arthrobacter sp. SDTb3-6]